MGKFLPPLRLTGTGTGKNFPRGDGDGKLIPDGEFPVDISNYVALVLPPRRYGAARRAPALLPPARSLAHRRAPSVRAPFVLSAAVPGPSRAVRVALCGGL